MRIQIRRFSHALPGGCCLINLCGARHVDVVRGSRRNRTITGSDDCACQPSASYADGANRLVMVSPPGEKSRVSRKAGAPRNRRRSAAVRGVVARSGTHRGCAGVCSRVPDWLAAAALSKRYLSLPEPRIPDRLGQWFQDGGIVGRSEVDDAQVEAFGGQRGRVLENLSIVAVRFQAQVG